MIIDELVTVLGLNIAAGVLPKIRQFQSMMENVVKTVSYASAGLVTAASGIAYFAERMNQTSAHMYRMGKVSGMSTDMIQEMGVAAEASGGSFDGMAQDLMSMQRAMTSPIPGQYNHALFMMGINAGKLKDAGAVFDEINKKMQGMTQQEKYQWASPLGLSDASLMFVGQSTKDYLEAKKTAARIGALISPQELKDANDFTIQLTMLHRIITTIGQKVSAVAGPAMRQLTGDFMTWLEKAKPIIQGGLQYTIEGILDGFRRFGQLLSWTKDKLSAFKDKVKDYFPEARTFIEWLNKMNIVGLAVFAALTLLSGVLFTMGASALLAHPIVLALTAALTALMAFLGTPTGAKFFDGFYDKAVKTLNIIKELIIKMDEMAMRGREQANREDARKKADEVSHMPASVWEWIKYTLASD